jgi:hypothetical protein
MLTALRTKGENYKSAIREDLLSDGVPQRVHLYKFVIFFFLLCYQ